MFFIIFEPILMKIKPNLTNINHHCPKLIIYAYILQLKLALFKYIPKILTDYRGQHQTNLQTWLFHLLSFEPFDNSTPLFLKFFSDLFCPGVFLVAKFNIRSLAQLSQNKKNLLKVPDMSVCQNFPLDFFYFKWLVIIY